jgi:hypothetical protein
VPSAKFYFRNYSGVQLTFDVNDTVEIETLLEK